MNILSLLTQFWWLLVLIGVMILVHELGHFWAARAFDVKVDVFSFGFGPRLFGFQRGETDYRFSLFLFGGYVKMAGDQPGDDALDPRGFLAKPRWQRLIIAFAGPFMNIVLAIGVLTGLFMVHFEKIIDDQGAVIGHIMPDSPAAKAGMRSGDKMRLLMSGIAVALIVPFGEEHENVGALTRRIRIGVHVDAFERLQGRAHALGLRGFRRGGRLRLCLAKRGDVLLRRLQHRSGALGADTLDLREPLDVRLRDVLGGLEPVL